MYNSQETNQATMIIHKFTAEQKETRRRIIELSYRSNLSHIGSCLTAIDIIDTIYRDKTRTERFVLSSGHAAIALYIILEKYGFMDSLSRERLHIHPDRNPDLGIDVSTGSLGQGLPIALGMALADKHKTVYCLSTDGECAEGSIWESLRIIYEKRIGNLIIVINANGWGAYDPIPTRLLLNRIRGFGFKTITVDGHNIVKLTEAIKTAKNTQPAIVVAKTNSEQLGFLKGQDAHYYVMNEFDYKLALERFK
jgi:transketolase